MLVTQVVADVLCVPLSEVEAQSDGDTLSVPLGEPENEGEPELLSVPLSVADAPRDGVDAAVVDTVAERHSVTVLVSDAMDGDAVGVDPARAHAGPMLNVDSCVPSMDSAGEADTTDGDPVADGTPVAI